MLVELLDSLTIYILEKVGGLVLSIATLISADS